jgi:hypothetical protein
MYPQLQLVMVLKHLCLERLETQIAEHEIHCEFTVHKHTDGIFTYQCHFGL